MKAVFKTLLTFFFIYITVFASCNARSVEEKQITVVFRFDDPSALSSTEVELKVIDTFREHNASVTFGVIPFKCKNTRDTSPQDLFPLGEKKGKLLRKAAEEGIVDIALHGYSHQMRKAEIWTEFWGMDYDSQLDKLSKGKTLIKEMTGTTVTAFIPPYNSYDLNTVKALEVLGFTTLSAGIYGEVSNESKLKFMPETIRLHQIHGAVERARVSSDKKPLIVIMFHQYDFMDVQIKGIDKRIITFKELNDHLHWLKSQKDVRILSLKQASEVIEDLSAKRLKMVNIYSSFKPIIPGFLRKNNSVYPERSSLLSTAVKTVLLYMGIIILSIVFSYIIGCFIFRKSVIFMKISTFGSTIITTALILYVISDMEIHLKGMLIITVFVGTSVGAWICFLSKKKLSS